MQPEELRRLQAEEERAQRFSGAFPGAPKSVAPPLLRTAVQAIQTIGTIGSTASVQTPYPDPFLIDSDLRFPLEYGFTNVTGDMQNTGFDNEIYSSSEQNFQKSVLENLFRNVGNLHVACGNT